LAPWCLPGQEPGFAFGFAALAQQLGSTMGEPIECEHGEGGSSNTAQATTTGIALYDWCTNTPRFERGQDHWMLTPGGIEHWSGSSDPPDPLPIVRAPDLRNLCPS
jgi:hypothetical protein